VRAWILIVCAAGCTRGNPIYLTPSLSDADLALAKGVDLLAAPPADLSSARREDLAIAPVADLSSRASAGCNVVINELLLSVELKPNEEFVELFNPCEVAVSLAQWKLVFRSALNNQSASNMDTMLVGDLNTTIAAGDFRVYAGSQLVSQHDGTLINGLSDSGGGVALVDLNGSIVDSVAYGPVISTHNFIEGMPAPLPPDAPAPGNTLVRLPDGHDTNDNSVDFVVSTNPTPRAANQP
jgi:hypothetical protein